MLSCLCKHLEQCCYWYNIIPSNISECIIAQHQTDDENNNSVGRVRWYRSLDLVTSEDVTDEYDAVVRPASFTVMSGNLAGLFCDTYSLIIHSIGPANNGYYWSQIVAKDTCSVPSPYVKISVNNSMVSVDNDSLCPSVLMFNYQNCAACNAPSTPMTLSSAAGSHTVNMTTSTTSHFQQTSSKTASSMTTHTVDMPLSSTLHAFPKHLLTSSRADSSTAA